MGRFAILLTLLGAELAAGQVRTFPEGFLLGTATASHQIEGAWNVADKTPNIWDHLTHTNPTAIDDASNADEAAESYYYYKRDVEMLRELGAEFYRISLSWPRLLPSGHADRVSEDGLNFYNNYINEMLAYNITPMITLYHWDLPQSLQDLGGWANPLIVDWFTDFARVAFESFGDRVKIWLSFNEPKQVCWQGYGEVLKAPMLNRKGVAEYLCSRNLILAHAKSFHLYDQEFRPTQGGKFGITVNMGWFEPMSDSEDDQQAAEDDRQFDFGTYTHPIFSPEGDFPKELKNRVSKKSAEQGYPRSRLPEFSPEEVDYIRGSADFLGINHYTTKYVYRNESAYGRYDTPSYKDDLEAEEVDVPNEVDDMENQYVGLTYVPSGFYKILKFVKERYNNPEVMITENGFGTDVGLDDKHRVTYYRGYLAAMLDAIEDGCHVTAYAAWTLMDNFEWMRGYTVRFGLYEVDFDSPEKTRTARKSALVYKQILKTRTLDPTYEPDPSLQISIG